MTTPRPALSSPLSLVAPFFLAAPVCLMLAGFMLTRTPATAFRVPNVAPAVAATHAAVLGWLTLAMMGAIYQLGPAVFRGRFVSQGMARWQFVVHAAAVVLFVFAARRWNVTLMSIAGGAIVVSLAMFVANAVTLVRWRERVSAPQAYVRVALVFLVLTACAGITYVGNLEHSWFPLTQGRVGGHAHLGLIGWLGLVVMGVSYQLVPMFEVAPRGAARFALPVLWITAVMTAAGSVFLMTDPGPGLRALVAVGFSVGPSLWLADMVMILRSRSRRKPDIHLRATALSLAFLTATIPLGVGAAIGRPIAQHAEPGRVALAYGFVAVGGWAGTTFIGNSFKIVPFLVWNERFKPLAGVVPVPLLAELTNAGIAHSVLAGNAFAVTLGAAASIGGSEGLLHVAGWCFVATGATHVVALAAIVSRRPRPGVIPAPRPVRGGVAL